MKTPLTLKRALTFTVLLLTVFVLISMDLDTKSIKSPKAQSSSPNKVIEPSIISSTDNKKAYDSAQYVLNAYQDAIGGERWKSIKTMHKTGLVSMKAGSSMALSYGKEMYQGVGGYLLEEINVNDSKLSQVMQDGQVMTLVRNNIYPQSGLEALSFKEHLLPIGNLDEISSPTARFMGRHLVEGKWVYKLFRGQQLGHDIYEYFEVTSKLKVMTSLGNGCHVKFKKYKSIDGLRIPTLVETYFKEFERQISYEVEQIAMNVTIPTSPIDAKSVSIESVVSN
ncbi:hypothetical protein [Roseivirga sp. E12]|uniref:hypothetical protein n=1 Tax=Roseivirga sp. E12 TaxID=2819237 RepID=UPI001ABC0268|nr:hypothetical protein [Roseivirga sp. E12]MBO3700870.1 hypothetical protein [Roseivirga sp. E12]